MPVPPGPDGLVPLDETEIEGSYTSIVTIPEDEPEEQAGTYDKVESELDPRHREDFIGLLYLGKLEEECTVAGHRFLLSTPDQIDRMNMGLVHKPYANTATGEIAWRTITVATYLRAIDGEPAPEPLTNRTSAVAERFRWVIESIHSDLVLSRLFDEVLLLDMRARALTDALDDVGKASA